MTHMDAASSEVYLSRRFLEMCNLTFFNKTFFQKSVSMYPVLGHLETPHGVPWDAKLGTWKQRRSN